MSEEKGMNWSLPLAVVLFGTGNVAFIVGLMMAGKIPPASGATSAAWLLALALIDIPAGLIMFKRGDTLLGTITLFLGTILCVGAAFSGLIRMFAPGGPIPIQFDAWMWIGIGAFLICIMPAVAKQLPWSVCIILCVVCGVGLVLWGIGQLQGIISLMKLAGWMVFSFGVFLFYAATAALTNEVYQREIFPLGRPIAK